MLKVYGDESYNRDRSLFAVAGVLGSVDEWRAVQAAWVKRTDGLEFHAAACESDKGIFSAKNARTHQQNQDLYKDLAKIIAGSKLLCTGVAMDAAAFREIFPDIHDDAPYYKAFVRVVRRCAEFAYMSVPQQQIRVYFDQDSKTNATAALFYDQLSQTSKWAHANLLAQEPCRISFPSRKNPRIQVADLIAREVMKYPEDPIGVARFPRRLSMDALRRAGRIDLEMFPRSYFQSWKDQWPKMEQHAGFDLGAAYWSWLADCSQTDSPYQRVRYLIHFEELEQNR